ncbi:E3 ubiquitin-protein ligase RNF4 [Pholidichthys leucotaenia]
MSSSTRRKRRASGSAVLFTTKTSRTAAAERTNRNSRRTAGTGRTPVTDITPPTETIDVMDNVEEVVDLTREGTEGTVVDLTTNDSVLLVEGPPSDPQNSSLPAVESVVVSSDDDEDTWPVLNSAHIAPSSADSSRSTPGMVSCPICMDRYVEIIRSGRLAVSTRCGHVFCSQCLRDALKVSRTCPNCRARLTSKQYHPLYI